MNQKKDMFERAFQKFELFALEVLEESQSKWTSKAFNAFSFISTILATIPKPIACNIAQKMLTLTDSDHSELKKNIYFTFETLFAAVALPSDFTEDFLKSLLEKQPAITDTQNLSNEEEVMVAGYCSAVSQCTINLNNGTTSVALKYLPGIISTLSEYLTYSSNRIQ
jgi:hypothetical protein